MGSCLLFLKEMVVFAMKNEGEETGVWSMIRSSSATCWCVLVGTCERCCSE